MWHHLLIIIIDEMLRKYELILEKMHFEKNRLLKNINTLKILHKSDTYTYNVY